MSPGTRTWEVLYYDLKDSIYRPLIGAQAIGTEGLVGETPSPFWETTDIDGTFITGCDHDQFYAYNFDVRAENSQVTVRPFASVATENSAPAGCSDPQIVALSRESHVFSQLRSAISASIEAFGQSAPQVTVKIDTTISFSRYREAGDTIDLRIIWGTSAREELIHEYGHHFQSSTLGGIEPDRPNCSAFEHGTPLYTSLECAYVEGFAEYFAAAVLGYGVSTEYNDFESGIDLFGNPNETTAGPMYPARNGSRVEGAVAAMLLDLTDPANETHDDLQLGAAYIGQLYETCEINHGAGLGRANGIDGLIRCLEKQIDSTISNRFWPRTATPSAYSEGATEPGSWNLTKIRTLWMKNLYNQ